MTRLLVCLPLLFLAAPLFAQNGPAPQYAPAGARVAGPQPARTAAVQSPITQPAAGTGAADQPIGPVLQIAPASPQQPQWIPLNVAHEKWVNTVLQYWEDRSNKIKALSCKFTRWEYDPVFGPKEPGVAKTIASGEIKYAQPDKGLFKVTSLSLFAGPPAKAGDKPQYVPQEASFTEHWVCDGNQVFEFDARNKRLIQRELPPDMKGKAIADGPLPFLFGARAETIRARYWVRGLPESGNGKYWLEAVPKSRQDAQNFKAVKIVLDEATYLPVLLEVLAPNYNAKTNPAKTTYQLSAHDVTDDKLTPTQVLSKLNIFKTAFYAPSTPGGWTRVVERADGTTASRGVPGALEATKPAAPRSLPLPR